ncbi:MAG: hypothetical protein AAF467_17250 [Actinomycetota bacterium]
MALTVALVAMLGMFGLLVILGGALGFELGQSEAMSAEVSAARLVQVLVGLAVAFGVLVSTGWPVLALYAGITATVAPSLWAIRRKRRRYISRLDGLADWVESVRDALAASSGLEQALTISTEHPPESIEDEVNRLRLNLRHRPITECLREFAKDLALPASDRIVGSLLLAISSGAGRLVPVLGEVSRSARREAATARSIDSGRGELYSQANTISGIVAVVVIGSVLFRRADMEAYGTFNGQIALLIVMGLLLGGVLAFHILASPAVAERPLAGVGLRSASRDEPASARGASSHGNGDGS